MSWKWLWSDSHLLALQKRNQLYQQTRLTLQDTFALTRWKCLFFSGCPGEPGELVIGGGSAHLGYFLFFRGFTSRKVWLKITWNWNPWSRKLFLLTWARTVCTPATDPSRTLPASWVRITHTPFGQAQRTSQNPAPCRAMHKRCLPVLT